MAAPGSQSTEGAATLRALATGAVLSLLIGAGVGYADNAVRGSFLAIDFGAPVAISLLFAISLFSPVVGLVKRSWQLTPAEVAVIHIMMLLATSNNLLMIYLA